VRSAKDHQPSFSSSSWTKGLLEDRHHLQAALRQLLLLLLLHRQPAQVHCKVSASKRHAVVQMWRLKHCCMLVQLYRDLHAVVLTLVFKTIAVMASMLTCRPANKPNDRQMQPVPMTPPLHLLLLLHPSSSFLLFAESKVSSPSSTAHK